jgi:hypothetical protein
VNLREDQVKRAAARLSLKVTINFVIRVQDRDIRGVRRLPELLLS